MKEYKNVRNMSDRELRILKKRLRKQRILRKRMLTLILTICVVFGAAFSIHSIKSSAKNGTDEIKLKYYTNVEVSYGETISEIAEIYIDYDYYSSMDKYLAEVKNINGLDDDYTVRAGQNLIIPYFSADYR